MKERISRFETKAAEQLDEVREIHTWLQNTQGAEILVGAPDSGQQGSAVDSQDFWGHHYPGYVSGYAQKDISREAFQTILHP